MTVRILGALLFCATCCLSAVLIPLLRRSAMNSGFVDNPDQRKSHKHPTPAVGGVAIILGIAVPAVAGLLCAALSIGVGKEGLESLTVHYAGILSQAIPLLTILGCAGVLHVMGYLDDSSGLGPWLRLAIQVGCALALSWTGAQITAYFTNPLIHHALTILVVVFLINATNFIDNMNGLSGGVVFLAALTLALKADATGQAFVFLILACLLGSVLGFLCWNFPVARVFMGDAGSMALGFLMAAFTISLTFDTNTDQQQALWAPLLVLCVPILDGVVAITGRILRGVHPFTAGHDHLSHRLVRRGLSKVSAVQSLWTVGALGGAAMLALAHHVEQIPLLGLGWLLLMTLRIRAPGEAGAHE